MRIINRQRSTASRRQSRLHIKDTPWMQRPQKFLPRRVGITVAGITPTFNAKNKLTYKNINRMPKLQNAVSFTANIDADIPTVLCIYWVLNWKPYLDSKDHLCWPAKGSRSWVRGPVSAANQQAALSGHHSHSHYSFWQTIYSFSTFRYFIWDSWGSWHCSTLCPLSWQISLHFD